jgi:hypothetical protein
MRDKIATLFAALLMVAAPVGVVAATQTAAHAATNGVQYSCYVNGAWTMFGQQVQWVGWRSDTINCRTYVM